MISQLTGQVVHKDLRSIILDVNGVGYRIFVSTDTLEGLKGNPQKVKFWTYLSVRENALDLYGFPAEDGLQFFEKLITVNGVGPKTAMGILSGASIETLRSAIASGEAGHLVKMAGVGRKMAEKLVLELKDKVGLMSGTADEQNAALAGEYDALEALKSLGYTEKESRDVLKKVGAKGTTSERVKAALKHLGSAK